MAAPDAGAAILPLETANVTVSATAGNKQRSSVAMRPDGQGFVVAWEAPDAVLTGIFFQRYNASWQAVGGRVAVNTVTANIQGRPSVGMDASGNFVIAWHSFNQAGASSDYDIYARRFLADGTAIDAAEFLVNTTTALGQQDPDVAVNASGQFVVVWDGGAFLVEDVFAKGYSGITVGGSGSPTVAFAETTVNNTSANSDDQYRPAVAIRSSGEFVVAYESYNQDQASTYGIIARRMNANGTPAAGEFLVNTVLAGDQTLADIAMDGNGLFAITWTSPNVDGNGLGVMMQRYNAAGTAQGSNTQVNTGITFGIQDEGRIVATAAGDYLVTWTSEESDVDVLGRDVYFKKFDPSGAVLIADTVVNTGSVDDVVQDSSAPAINSAGDFVIAFKGPVSGSDEILLRRFGAAPVVQFSAASSSVSETVGTAPYTVTRTGAAYVIASLDTLVNVNSTGGTATAVSDFSTIFPQTLTIPIGSLSQSASVDIVNDATFEGNETLSLGINSSPNHTLGVPSTHTLTINNDDASPTANISNVAVVEGDSGTVTATFTITLTATSGLTTSVGVATANVTATAGTDYVASSGTVVFVPGVTSQTHAVTVNGNTIFQANRTFRLNISSVVNATAGTNGTGTITDDDAPATIAISSGNNQSAELNTSFASPLVALVRNAGGNPVQGVSVTFTAPGAGASAMFSTTTNTITATSNASGLASTGTFTASGSVGTNYSVFASASGGTNPSTVFTLTNTSPLPSVSVSTTATAGDNDAAEGGANTGTFTFTRSQTTGPLVANFQLNAGSTATAGTDFTLSGATSFNNGTGAGSVTFANGVGTVTVTLTALTETPNPAEAAETARLDVVASPGVYNAGASPNATVTITENSFLVTTTSDSGTGSLRQAIANANAIAGADTITLSDGTGGTVNFTDASPETITLSSTGDGTAGPSAFGITSPITIVGPGGNGGLTLSSAGTPQRLFYVAPAGSLTLHSLTLSGGSAVGGNGGNGGGGGGAGLGGAIFNRGSLTLLSSTLSGNTAQGGNGGGMTLTYGGGGGGMGGNGGDNDGGGPNGGTYEGTPGGFGGGGGRASFIVGGFGGFGGGGGASSSALGGNGGFGGGAGPGNGNGTAGFGGGAAGSSRGGGGAGMGGAIFNAAGSVSITNSTLSANTARGGAARSNVAFNGSGLGGAVFNLNGTLNLQNSTLTDNSVNGGTTQTFMGTADGGAVYTLGLNNVWESGTQSGATVGTAPGAQVSAVNTIFSSTTGSNTVVNNNGTFGGSNNLATQSSGLPTGVSSTTTSALMLGSLASNGGPTQTCALFADSPALNAGANMTTLSVPIDAITTTILVASTAGIVAGPTSLIQIDNEQMIVVAVASSTNFTVSRGANGTSPASHASTAGVNPAFDQRGTGFPRVMRGSMDIGAFEVQNFLSIAALDAVKVEGNAGSTSFTFTVSRTGTTAGVATASYAVSGAAVTAQDFVGNVLPTGTVTIPDGDTSTTLTILVNGDTVVEPGEAFTVTLSNPSAGTGFTTPAATGTITNDDTALATVTRTDHAAEQGAVNGSFQVSLTAPASTDTVVSYGVTGTAESGTDYTALAGTVTITAGSTTAAIVVPVINDRSVEGSETVIVTLSGTNNASITPGTPNSATLNIVDNDRAELSLVNPTLAVSESAGQITTRIYLHLITDGTGPELQSRDFRFRFTARAGSTASIPDDLTFVFNHNILPGEGSYTFDIATPTIVDDVLVEGNETLILGIDLNADATGGQHSVTPATQTLTITDNDSAQVAFVSGASNITESNATVTPSLTLAYTTTGTGTPAMANDLTINFNYTGSTATAGTDYTGPASMFIPKTTAGGASIPVQVEIFDDAIVEPDETVALNAGLSADPTNGQVTMGAVAAHTVSIQNNDFATVSIAKVNDGAEGPPIIHGKFRVTQTAVSSTDTVINYLVTGTATPGAGNDYTALPGQVTILAGNTTADIDVLVLADAVSDPTETVIVTFNTFGPHNSGVTFGSPTTATVNIISGPVPLVTALGDVVTDNAAPGADGTTDIGKFDLLRRSAYLAQNGDIAFTANLLVGAGPPVVTNNDFQGIWAKDAANPVRLIARSGSIAPGTGNAVFDILPEVVAVSDVGDVTFFASLRVGTGSPAVTASNDTGIWSTASVAGANPVPALVAREGAALRSPSNAVITKFATGCFATSQTNPGVFVFSATEADGKTGVYVMTSINGSPTAAVTTAKEGNSAPGAGGEVYDNLASGFTDPARIDQVGNFCYSAKVKPSGKEGIWYAPIATGIASKVVIMGDAAPGTTTTFSRMLDMPAMGGTNNIAFHAYMAATGDNAANNRGDGIWKGVAPAAINTYTLVIRCGDTGVAGLPGGAKVGNLWTPWMSNANHLAFRGWVDVNGDGVSANPTDVQGLYTDTSGTMTMVIKQGDAAPGMPAGATMVNMDLPVIGGQEQMAFIGSVTGGGTTSANNQGIWRQAANGGALALVARTGETVTTSQGTKTVAKLDFPGTSQNGNTTDHRWEQAVMDGTGRMVIQLTFTDGTTAQALIN